MRRSKDQALLGVLGSALAIVPGLVGAAVGAFYGWVIATIVGGLVAGISGEPPAPQVLVSVKRDGSSTTYTYRDSLRERPVRGAEMLLGLLAGGMAGGCLAFQGKIHRGYAYGLFTRIGLAGIGLPVMRLAYFQGHWPTAAVFWLLGTSILMIGWYLIAEIVLQTGGLSERAPRLAAVTQRMSALGAVRLLTFAPIGVALILFGAYFTGGVELSCIRSATQRVDAVLKEHRWLGQVHVRTTMIQGLRETRFEDGIVLVADSGEVHIPGHMNDLYASVGAIDEFLKSARPALTVRSEPRFVFLGCWLLAMVLLLVGYSSEPVTAPVEEYAAGKHWIQVFESRLLVIGTVLCLLSMATFWFVIPAVQANATEDHASLLNGATLTNATHGLEAIVEGRVGASNRVVFNDFVMYHLEQRDTDGGWSVRKRMTPPFVIDLPGAGAEAVSLQVINDTYALDAFSNAPVESLAAEQGDRQLRYRGYARGSPVTAYGQITRTNGEPQFRAWWLFGGTYDEYLRDGDSKLRLMKVGGTVFAAAGTLMLGLFIRKLAISLR